jgi:hypothetical protein
VLFDEVDPERGTSFRADHPQLADDAERRRLLDYLASGEPLLLTTARMEDVVERARGLVVPVNFRTDGSWVWTDSSAYYLDQYGLVPDQELVAHIRSLDYEFPEVDGVAVHRTLDVLQQPPEEEPVWTYGDSASSGIGE